MNNLQDLTFTAMIDALREEVQLTENIDKRIELIDAVDDLVDAYDRLEFVRACHQA